MIKWQFSFIVMCLIFILFKLTNNDFIFGMFGLIFVILTLIQLLIPKKIIEEYSYRNNKLTNLKIKGKKIKITKELENSFRNYKEAEEEFNNKIDKYRC